MGTLIKQELYKLVHKRGTWLALAFMVLTQIGFAIIGKFNPEILSIDTLIASNYIGGALIIFIMIASTATIISMEFQYGTIKQLLYRQYYRSQIFISKIIVLLLQFLVLQVVATLMTFILTFILKPDFHWQAPFSHQTFIQQYFLSMGGNWLVTLLLLSFVLLLATWFKTNAAAIVSGFVGYFIVQIASSLLILLIGRWEWLKWNPLTMLLVQAQINSPDMSKVTMLSTSTMVAGALIYTVIFTVIAYFSFRKRSV